MIGKAKTRGLPRLPADDIVVHGDQIDFVRIRDLHSGDWTVHIWLHDGQDLLITFHGDAHQLLQGGGS